MVEHEEITSYHGSIVTNGAAFLYNQTPGTSKKAKTQKREKIVTVIFEILLTKTDFAGDEGIMDRWERCRVGLPLDKIEPLK